tara:strand:+ start:35 stop:580 length:546 start_codon:yes stop_codon:yes gene_type:complete
MKRKNSFNRNELLECSEGKLFDTNHARVPTDPLLMVDRITNITINGGKYNKGIIIAELDINEKKWFFHSHFIGDPVMPGCLGLDGMWQLIGFFLTWSGCIGRGRALGVGNVKFKGQVRPYHKVITYKINVKKLLTKPIPMVWGDGEMYVKGKKIYTAKGLQVGLFDNLIYDFGGDPYSDTF